LASRHHWCSLRAAMDTNRYAVPAANLGTKESTEMGVEPGDGAADAVALVVGLHEEVAFVFVDDELGFDA
jgi:hypothetical protein